MEWLEAIPNIVGVIIGGILVMIADWLRDRSRRKSEMQRSISSLYAAFFVAQRRAMRSRIEFCKIVLLQEDGLGPARVPERDVSELWASEKDMREAGWALSIRENDRVQRERIQSLMDAFDSDLTHWSAEIRDAEKFMAGKPEFEAILQDLISYARQMYSISFN